MDDAPLQNVINPENETITQDRYVENSETSPPPARFHYRVILGGVTAVAIVVGLIMGILLAVGALDKSDGSPSAVDGFNKDGGVNQDENVVLDVCAFQEDFDIRGDGSLLMRQFIHNGDETVTIQMEYNGVGWIGFAFSESTAMVPNTAVIGLPESNTVQKYSLAFRSVSGVIPLDSSVQTLSSATITQDDSRTIMTFTKNLKEPNEVAVQKGENRFNWAFGSSNDLARHQERGSATLTFVQCLAAADEEQQPPIAPVPTTAAPIVVGTIPPVATPFVGGTDSPIAVPSYSPTNGAVMVPIAAPTPVSDEEQQPPVAPVPTTTTPIVVGTSPPVATPFFVEDTDSPIDVPSHSPANQFLDEDPFNGAEFTNIWQTKDGLGLELVVVYALDTIWQPYFFKSVDEWNSGTPDTLTLTTEIAEQPDLGCSAIIGKLKVCNGNYGETNWRGINKILLENNWIYSSAARMNDYYNSSNDGAQRQYTMCHEVSISCPVRTIVRVCLCSITPH
jgi:hypothetical protein